MTTINFLQNLFMKNNECEIGTGIQIVTGEDGTWHVFIDLFNTEYESTDFDPVFIHKNATDWVRCFKESQIFKGFGGAQNLCDILNIFNMWLTNREIEV